MAIPTAVRTEHRLLLDLKGYACPIPIARTARAIRDVPPGSVVEVLATDPGSVPDFRAWSLATGNPLLESSQEGGVYRFVVRKREA
jgi:tRNA 2-thiouridine synthesizing protein A